jgi:3-methyl-2-oxobutanoate hydroxymethyltransferase
MSDASPVSKVTLPAIADMRGAALADQAGIDIVLVGDSAGTTVFGGHSTVPVTMDEMVLLTRDVARGARRAFLVADMPFGSYQVSEESAINNAIRLVKEGGADAVKLEGAGRTLTRIGGIVDAGVPVMGHIGLTPQSATMLGGYRAQARTAAAAKRLVDQAVALERAGCFSIVLEAIPAVVAERATEAVRIPTIGIGAGPGCSGQVLVWHDLLGLSPEPTPRFVKRYASLAGVISAALAEYVRDVRSGAFPDERHTYGMPDAERERFEASLSVKK